VARALAAAIVVSLLAVSGAGGSSAQTPRKGGTAVFGAPFPEPACLNVLLARCSGGGPATFQIGAKVLEGPFEVDQDFTFRPNLASGVTVTRRPPFTLTYRIQPEARWSDGVPITAADFLFTHQAYVSLARKRVLNEDLTGLLERVRRVTAVGSKTVRAVLRSRFAGWRRLFENILPRHALAGADPSSSDAGSAASNSRSAETPTTGGLARRISRGSVFASSELQGSVWTRSGRGGSTSP
jgi:ABC-type transport system substrate-binding protein